MDLYSALGIARDADDRAIKIAHRRAAKIHHPDLGGEQEAFDRIQRAFAILADPDKRRRYDETGEFSDLPASSEQQAVLTAAREAVMTIVLGLCDLCATDVIGQAISQLEGRVNQLTAQARLIDSNIERLRTVRQRLTRPALEGEDLLSLVIDQQERDLNGSRPNIETGIRVANAAIALLGCYAYRVDAAGISLTISRSAGGNIKIG